MKFPIDMLFRAAKNIVKLKFTNNKNLDVLIPGYYITCNCNIDCFYCNDGTDFGRKYANLHSPNLDTDNTKKILKIIRKKSSCISITGGEPLIRKDIVELFRYMKDELNYKTIILNTNALLLDEKREILNCVDRLLISLDTTDMESFSKIINRPIHVAEKIRGNIIKYSSFQKEKGFRMGINNVISPDNIECSRKVLDFCTENDLVYSPMPNIVGKTPHPSLVGNTEYQEFIHFIIDYKRGGGRVLSSFETLNKIINFERHECLPTLITDIYPDGTLFYPCHPLDKRGGNLLETGDWDKAVDIGIKKHGKIAKCQYSCHISCFMEPSYLMAHPLSIYKEFRQL